MPLTTLPPARPALVAQAPASRPALARIAQSFDLHRRKNRHAHPGPRPPHARRASGFCRELRSFRVPSLAPMRLPGEDALGVSVPKRRRWLVLGGHGRNGPG